MASAIRRLTRLVSKRAHPLAKYVMQNLGCLPGDDQSSAEAINSKGQIVGKSWSIASSGDPMNPRARAFLWENAYISEIKAAVGEDGIYMADINDSGVMLVGGWEASFIIENGKATKIEPLPGGKTVGADQINNYGDVLAYGNGAGEEVRLLIHRAGVTYPLDKPVGYSFVYWNAMNNESQVASNIERSDGTWDIALWDDGKLRILDGAPKGLCVCALTDDGTIAGILDPGGDVKGVVWRSGSLKYLRAPRGLDGPFPECINNKGVIAGKCPDDEGVGHAVVWDANGVATELPMVGGVESEAADINDAGIIVGTLVDADGKSHAVMWTPVK